MQPLASRLHPALIRYQILAGTASPVHQRKVGWFPHTWNSRGFIHVLQGEKWQSTWLCRFADGS